MKNRKILFLYRKGKSALPERVDVEYRKFKETLTSNDDGNLEPSLFKKEGAETIHDIPKSSFRHGKEIVQTTNIFYMVTKVIVVRKSVGS